MCVCTSVFVIEFAYMSVRTDRQTIILKRLLNRFLISSIMYSSLYYISLYACRNSSVGIVALIIIHIIFLSSE